MRPFFLFLAIVATPLPGYAQLQFEIVNEECAVAAWAESVIFKASQQVDHDDDAYFHPANGTTTLPSVGVMQASVQADTVDGSDEGRGVAAAFLHGSIMTPGQGYTTRAMRFSTDLFCSSDTNTKTPPPYVSIISKAAPAARFFRRVKVKGTAPLYCYAEGKIHIKFEDGDYLAGEKQFAHVRCEFGDSWVLIQPHSIVGQFKLTKRIRNLAGAIDTTSEILTSGDFERNYTTYTLFPGEDTLDHQITVGGQHTPNATPYQWRNHQLRVSAGNSGTTGFPPEGIAAWGYDAEIRIQKIIEFDF